MSENRNDAELLLPPPLPDTGGGPPLHLLANRPFLWLVMGEGFAGIALWAFFLAVIGDATYRLDASPGELGILLASFSVTFIPSTPAFGTLADRWSPQRMMLIGMLGLVGSILIAVAADSVQWLYLSMAAAGVTEGVLWPARGALVPRLVPRDRLVQANGMVGVAHQIPMALGPAIAGLVVGLWGPEAPYLAALVAVAVALPFYRLVPDRRAQGKAATTFLRDLVGGLREGLRIPVLRALFALGVAVMFLIGLLITLEPLFVRRILDRGQAALGLLWSVHGVGGLLGSLALVRLRSGARREMLLVGAGITLGGAGFLLYVGTASLVTATVGTAVLGVGFTLFFTPAQALIQRISAAPGRVTAVFVVISEAGPFVAALLIGVLGRVSVQPWLVASALAYLVVGLAGLWVARRPSLVAEGASP